jgi:hypothetical protein
MLIFEQKQKTFTDPVKALRAIFNAFDSVQNQGNFERHNDRRRWQYDKE